MDNLVPVVPIPVHHGIHHALANRHPNSVLLVLVETDVGGRFQNYGLGFIHTFKSGWVILVQQCL